jgi:hypothetical protein
MKNSFLVIAGFLVAIMIAELLSLSYVGISTKRLFYTLPTVPISDSAEVQKINKKSLIHPYFGYVLSLGKLLKV